MMKDAALLTEHLKIICSFAKRSRRSCRDMFSASSIIGIFSSNSPLVKLALATLSFFCLFGVSYADENWQVKKTAGHIDTYVGVVEGSRYKAAKHVAVINTSINQLFDAVGDGSSCLDWLSLCISAKKLEQVSQYEYLGYVVVDMPWPLSNRDFVYRSTATVNPSSGAIHIEQVSEPDSYPVGEFIRMQSKNTFYIEPLSEQTVRLTWIVHSNPGGNVPASLVNSRIHKDTRKDLVALVDQLHEYR